MDGLADSSQGISMERNGIKSSEELQRTAEHLTGKPEPIRTTDKIVGIVE